VKEAIAGPREVMQLFSTFSCDFLYNDSTIEGHDGVDREVSGLSVARSPAPRVSYGIFHPIPTHG
jgi:hypothetical protein